MKKKLLGILLTAVLVVCAFTICTSATETTEPAITEIGSAEAFVALMAADADLTGNYKLTADINLSTLTDFTQSPIGTSLNPFTGTFDGDGHTVSGVSITSEAVFGGLFGVIKGATVKNLTAVGSITSSADYSGGMIAVAFSPVTLSNLVSELTVTSTAAYSGGVVGTVYFAADGDSITVENCENKGAVTATKYLGGVIGIVGSGFSSEDFTNISSVAATNNTIDVTNCKNRANVIATTGNVAGGVVGYVMYRAKSGTNTITINKCMNTGAIKASTADKGFVGGILGAHLDASNNYCCNTTISECVNYGGFYADVNSGTIVGYVRLPKTGTFSVSDCKSDYSSLAMVATFENQSTAHEVTIARMYNANGAKIIGALETINTAEGETVAAATNVAVTLVDNCNKTSTAEEKAALSAKTLWTDVYGEPALKTFAEISSADDLVYLMNNSDMWQGAYKLTADIDLTGVTTTPIGNSTTSFAGVFDGNGHTISGWSYTADAKGTLGFFGKVKNGVVANLILEGTLTQTTSGDYVGALIGHGVDSVTVDNCTVNVTVNAAGSGVGGVIGTVEYTSATGGVTKVVNTRNVGDITGAAYVGGIIGLVKTGASSSGHSCFVENCVNYGDVVGTTGNCIGGIMGYFRPLHNTTEANQIDLTINNCANYATVNSAAGNSGYSAGILGALLSKSNSLYSNVTLTNLYNEGEIIALSGKSHGAIIGVVYHPVIDATTTDAPFTFENWLQAGSTDERMIGACNTLVCNWSLVNVYNTSATTLVYTSTQTDGTLAYRSNNIIFTNCYNSDSEDVSALNTTEGWLDNNGTILVEAAFDQIDSAEELVFLMNHSELWDKNFKLTADIDLTGMAQTRIGDNNVKFTGTFDGDGHTISGLNIVGGAVNYQGLFGAIQNAYIKDLTVCGAVSGKAYVGGLAGFVRASTIENVNVDVDVDATSSYVGGLAGYMVVDAANAAVRVSGCTSRGTVDTAGDSSVAKYAGGIIGVVISTEKAMADMSITVEDCVNYANVTAEGNCAGGIIGYSMVRTPAGSACDLTVTRCANYGDITAYAWSGGINGAVLELANTYDVNVTYTDLYNAGTIHSTGNTTKDAAIIGESRNPIIAEDGNITVTYSDWMNRGTVTAGYGLVFPSINYQKDADGNILTDDAGNNLTYALNWTLTNAYNAVDSALIGSSEVTSEEVAYHDNTITLVNCANNASETAALETLAAAEKWTELCGVPVLASSITEIDSAEDLINLMNDSDKWSGNYKLTADIDLDTYTGALKQMPIGNADLAFTGMFDGQSHKITNIDINTTTNDTALFGHIQNAMIVGLELHGSVKSTSNQVGALVGLARPPFVIKNITSYVTVDATAGHAGAIIGTLGTDVTAGECIIDNCVNNGEIAGKQYIGGIVGYVGGTKTGTDITISNCVNYADVSTTSANVCGGILGYYNHRATSGTNLIKIDTCANYGDVNGAGIYNGGIVGAIFSGNKVYAVTVELTNLYSTGNVTGTSTCGGVIGLVRCPLLEGGYTVTVSDLQYNGTANLPVIHSFGNGDFTYIATNLYNTNGETVVTSKGDANTVVETNWYNASSTDFLELAENENWVVAADNSKAGLKSFHVHEGEFESDGDSTHSRNCWCGETVTEAHTLNANGICTACGFGDCTHAAGEVVFSYDAERSAIIYTRTCCESELYVDTTLNTTVYVDSTASDVAATDTLDAAVDTFGTFEFAMEYAALVANEKGNVTVVIKDIATLNEKYYSPEYEGTITVTGANGTDIKGILYFGAKDGHRRYYANGDVTFTNLTFTSLNDNGVKIFAQNHTMVMGTGITMDNEGIHVNDDNAKYPAVNGVKMYVFGGFESNNSQQMNTNLTIRSGNYHFVGGWNHSDASHDNCGVGNLTIGKKLDSDELYCRYIVGFSTGVQELTAASTVNITIDGKVDCHMFMPGTQNDLTEKKDVLYTTNLYLDGDMNAVATDTLPCFDVTGTSTATNTALNIFVDCTNEEALNDMYLIAGGDPKDEITADTAIDNMKTVVTVSHTGNETLAWAKDDDAYVVTCSLCGTVLRTQTEAPTVYVGDDGDDSNSGFTATTKVKSLTEAVERIASVGGTVMFNGYVTLSENTTLADWGDNTILFTADPDTHVDGVAASGIYITADLVQLTLGGKSEFDAIAFKGKDSTNDCIIINAMWHDIDFGYIHSVNYGSCYLMAGKWGATESDTTPVTQVINVDGNTADTTRAYFFGRIYMGSEIQANNIEISNKNITLNLENGVANANTTERTVGSQVYTIYSMSTTGNNNYCNSTTNGCVSVVNFSGDMSVCNFRTGDRNTSISSATGKSDDLTLNFMGNSQIDGSAYIRNCYKTTINISTEAQGRTKPLAHSFFFYGWGNFVESDAKVYITYGTHSFVPAISYPPVSLDADGDGASYVLVENNITDECVYDGVITTEPTDKTLGVKTFTCTCGRTYTEPVCGTYAHAYAHKTVADGENVVDLYVCEICGDVSNTLVMPDNSVLISAKASEIVDGEVTVDIWLEADAMAATLFSVDAPDGFTLESIVDVEDSLYLEQPQSLTLPASILLFNLVDGENVSVNGKVATLTFTVDSAVFTEDGVIAITAEESINADEENLYTATVNAEVSTAQALSMNVKYGLSVILKGDFVLEYLVQTTENVDVDNSWIEIHGVKGNIKPYTYTQETADGVTTTTLRFYAPDIAAKNMNDAIYYDFHTVIDGVEYAGETTSRNIVTYYELAQKTYGAYAGQGQVDSFLNLFYTMFNYGAAAQTYFGHNTDALVNEHLDPENVNDYADIAYENQFEQEAVEGQIYTLVENSVTLKQKVSTTLKFTASELSTDGISFKANYTNYEGTVITIDIPAGDERIYIDGGYLCVNVDTITPKDFREEFKGALYNGNTQVSTTVTASVEAYAANILEGTNDKALTEAGENVENLKAVCRALLAYSDAAKDLFYKITVNAVK